MRQKITFLAEEVIGFAIMTAIDCMTNVIIACSVSCVNLTDVMYCLCAPGEASKGSAVPQPEESG